MARIPLPVLDSEETPAELAGTEGNITGVVDVFRHLPLEYSRAYADWHRVLNHQGTLSRRLVELVRLRIAFHNQCRNCMSIRREDALDDGLTEDMVCSLEKPAEAPGLTDAERAALRFGDLMATNHLSINDADIAELRKYFTLAEVVELGANLATFIGFGRFLAVCGVVDTLPTPHAGAGDAIGPWNIDAVTWHTY